METSIHNTAIIEDGVELGENVSVGPYCIIHSGVKIKSGTRLISNIIIESNTEIGEDCTIYPFASVGLPPQDLKYDWRETKVKIGNKNIIREYTTIHRASISGDGITEVGDDNYIMAYVHIAHDCKLGSHNVMANVATLAGHVVIEDHVIIGGLVAVHQFTRLGAYSMVGGFSGIGQDIPPYMIASGPRARLYGPNVIGLRRHGFNEEDIRNLKNAYKIIFRDKLTLKEAITKIENELPPSEHVSKLINFLVHNKRGITRKL
ncbi:MAG: acyl-ACP--UDP-N-acetylglucosamine O-acyltransferase [Candidatus Magnetoovum sp. WYHC-5]|nr:acyl-ACP--UDP-N-acetylglucosamine O-acyltransferase [Candidatus Magnetoovum sp. WYHC-5]